MAARLRIAVLAARDGGGELLRFSAAGPLTVRGGAVLLGAEGLEFGELSGDLLRFRPLPDRALIEDPLARNVLAGLVGVEAAGLVVTRVPIDRAAGLSVRVWPVRGNPGDAQPSSVLTLVGRRLESTGCPALRLARSGDWLAGDGRRYSGLTVAVAAPRAAPGAGVDAVGGVRSPGRPRDGQGALR